MQRLLSALASLPLLAGGAFAAQPLPLNDAQMDAVRAGEVTHLSGGLTLSPAIGAGLAVPSNFLFVIEETQVNNGGTVILSESPVPCAGCFLSNIGNENLFISAQFGPAAGLSNSFTVRTTVGPP